MAAPIIKVKRSAVAGKIPTIAGLELGEFAINTYDGKVYIEQDQGGVGVGTTIVVVNPWSVGLGSTEYNTYFTAGSVGIGTTLPKAALNVVGVVSATSFFGDGANVTGISTLNIVNYGVGLGGGGGESYWISNSAGIHTLSAVGVGTTNPTVGVTSANTTVLAAGIVTAYKFYGDGSNITGISAIARVTVSQTAPSSPTAGDLWYHSTQARLFVYYNDGTSSQWVDAAPFNLEGSGAASVSVGATAPSGPSDGDLWYNSNYGRLFVYYKDGTSDQWVDAAPFNFAGLTTSTYTENSFVATAGQTTFNVTYDIGYVDVFINGIRLSSSEYTAADGATVVLDDAAALGDVVDIIEVATNRGPTGPKGDTGSSVKNVYSYTATASQTSFAATYAVGYADVFLNGIKLTESEYTATDGTTVVLNEGATVGDIVEIIGYEIISLTNGTYSTIAGIATVATYAITAGIATYSTSSGIATYASTAGIATYATTAGIATYATSSGIATYATTAGVSTSVIGGIGSITQLNVSGVSTFSSTTFTGNVSFGSSVYFGDNEVLYFGDSNDLYIVHNGSISAIADVGAGDLYIANDNALSITNAAYTENKAVFNSNGSVELYYDNSKKFETSGVGVTVYGATTITGNLNAPGNYYVKLARLTNQTVSQNTDTLIGFTATSDTNGWYSGITTRTTPTVAGTYNVNAMMNISAGSATNNQTNIQLRKNGSTFAISQVGIQTFAYTMNACGIVTMNGTTDYIEFSVYTGNPGGQTVVGTSDGAWTKMEIFKIN